MERDTPTIHRAPDRALLLRKDAVVVPASEDAATASTLARSLRRRPGHVVVTAPFSTTAGRIFEMAEPQLGSSRVVRLSARLLVETEVARAIVGVTQRGLPPPSPSEVAGVVEETKRQNRRIVLLVDDGDAVQVDRLVRIAETLGRTPEIREVVRLVLLGSGQLLRTLSAPEAAPFVDTVALHLDVSSPEPITLAPAARPAPTRRRRLRREPRWLLNEKLLVLAVGAVLVTGVLLFPIEPTVYPPPPVADAPEGALPVDDAAPAAPGPPVEEGLPPDAPVPAPAAAASATSAESPPATPARFLPPATPGPGFQIGAFRDRENAVRLAERLAGDFGGVYIDQLGQGGASLHRVRVPAPGTVLGETTMARALASRGFAPVRFE